VAYSNVSNLTVFAAEIFFLSDGTIFFLLPVIRNF
jgi:hypothetical protein